MAEQLAFEARLADAYARYVAAAPTEVDAAALARAVATGPAAARAGHPGSRPFGSLFASRPLRLALVAALALAVAAAVLVVGSLVLRRAPLSLHLSTLPDMVDGPRIDPVVVGLADGRVLIAGGRNTRAQTAALRDGPPVEILDPSTGAVLQIDDATPSGSGLGVELADQRVLVLTYDSFNGCGWAHLVDPRAATSRQLPQVGACHAPPFGIHASLVRLADGRVLVSGGRVDVNDPPTCTTPRGACSEAISRGAVIFDPATERFEATGPMTQRRIGHGIALLGDGRVLIVGGGLTASHAENPVEAVSWNAHNDIEIFDPKTGTFAAAGSMQVLRGATIAVTLADGRVVLFADQRHGIRDAQAQPVEGPFASVGPFPVEIHDPATGRSSVAGTVPHGATGAFALPDGRVFVHGWVQEDVPYTGPGTYASRARAWAAVFDPASGQTTDLAEPRAALSGSTSLPDGRIVLAGGWAFPAPGSSVDGAEQGILVPFVDLYE